VIKLLKIAQGSMSLIGIALGWTRVAEVVIAMVRPWFRFPVRSFKMNVDGMTIHFCVVLFYSSQHLILWHHPHPLQVNMPAHFTWICHAATAAMRSGTLPTDEPIDDKNFAQTAALAPSLPQPDRIWISPALRTRQTASALGLTGTVEPALREYDYGAWTGRNLADIGRQDETALKTWLSDPSSAPHGGESLTGLITRVGAWIDAHRQDVGQTLIFTHANVIRAAVIHVIQATPSSFSRIDVAPLSMTTFSVHNEKWRLVLS
jgi:broad specificity phosphatase PhoE